MWVSRDRFEAVLDAVVDRDDVRITFDDGNASDVEIGLPALQERGLTATFFVVAGRLDQPGFLDADAAARARRRRHAHRQPRHAPPAVARPRRRRAGRGAGAARATLEDAIGTPVDEAACPFGSYDRRVVAALRRSGYRHVFTCDRGTVAGDEWLQARNTIASGDAARRPGRHRGADPRGPRQADAEAVALDAGHRRPHRRRRHARGRPLPHREAQPARRGRDLGRRGRHAVGRRPPQRGVHAARRRPRRRRPPRLLLRAHDRRRDRALLQPRRLVRGPRATASTACACSRRCSPRTATTSPTSRRSGNVVPASTRSSGSRPWTPRRRWRRTCRGRASRAARASSPTRRRSSAR